MFMRRKVLGFVDEQMLSVYRDRGVVVKDEGINFNKTAEDRSIYQLVEPGWFVVNRMKAWQGSVGVSGLRGIISGHYICIEPIHHENDRFLHYYLRSPELTAHFRSISRGVRPGQIEIDNDQLADTRIQLPDLDEQKRIADFLDDRVSRIDRIIAARREQAERIRKLFEADRYRDLLGMHAGETVRTSLPWAPLVGADRPVRRLSQMAAMGTGHTPSKSNPEYWVDCDIPWLTTSDVHRFRRDEIDEIDETSVNISALGLANSAAVLHREGTVALSRTASAGFSIVMARDMATSQDFVTWTCGPELDAHFLLASLRTMRSYLLGNLAMGSTHKTIYFPDLMDLRLPVPRLDVQRAVAAEIEGRSQACMAVEALLGEQIVGLAEYKSSLITAAVTGELDVTTAGSSIPG